MDFLPNYSLPKNPLLFESTVEPDIRPYVVTTPGGFAWIAKEGSTKIRVGVRSNPCTPETLQQELIQEILDTALEFNWGSVVPLSPDGLKQGTQYLAEYGYLEPLKIHASDVDLTALGLNPNDSDEMPWLPSGLMVLIPADLFIRGKLWKTQSGLMAALMFDPSRAFAFLK